MEIFATIHSFAEFLNYFLNVYFVSSNNSAEVAAENKIGEWKQVKENVISE